MKLSLLFSFLFAEEWLKTFLLCDGGLCSGLLLEIRRSSFLSSVCEALIGGLALRLSVSIDLLAEVWLATGVLVSS